MSRNNTSGTSIRLAFGIVGLCILLSLVIGASVIFLFSPDPAEESSPLITALALFTGQTLMAIPVLIYFSSRKQPLLKSIRFTTVPGNTLFYTLVSGLGLLILFDEIDRILTYFIQLPEPLFDLSPYLKAEAPLTAIMLVLTMVVFAPVGEEIVFRGFLQRILEKTWKDPTRAVLVTSMFFALIHLNPFWLIQIYMWGVVLGYLAFHTGSIIPGILLHGLNNGASILINSSGADIGSFYTWKGHVSPIFILCGVLCLSYGFKKIQSSRKGIS